MPRCPQHDLEMISSDTQFGTRWSCPEDRCSYAAWGNNPPADLRTRNLRKKAHALADGLWRSGIISRDVLYKSIQKVMCLPPEKAHIQLMNSTELEVLINWITGLRAYLNKSVLHFVKLHEEKAGVPRNSDPNNLIPLCKSKS